MMDDDDKIGWTAADVRQTRGPSQPTQTSQSYQLLQRMCALPVGYSIRVGVRLQGLEWEVRSYPNEKGQYAACRFAVFNKDPAGVFIDLFDTALARIRKELEQGEADSRSEV